MLNYMQFCQEQSIYYIISEIDAYGYIYKTNCFIFTPPGEITEAEGNDNIMLLYCKYNVIILLLVLLHCIILYYK